MKVFLGGTCNNSTWRDELIPQLTVDYFNPVVEDWTPACMKREREEREQCDICLYVITPKMTGVYAIAELIDDSNKRPEKTVICINYKDGENWFDSGQIRSLIQVTNMASDNGATVLGNLDDVAIYLNGMK
jgi:hypothetical protein